MINLRFTITTCLLLLLPSLGFSGSEPDLKPETVSGDPYNAQVYTLPNGLKVYLKVNKDEPKVTTRIAVRAGSKFDPADATGLAHYLEHMLFKGTDEIGTSDWDAEKALLAEISDLYEKRRKATSDAERAALYRQIDSVSGLAAGYALTNEFDQIISAMGGEGTNAYTSVEQTVYINTIPANELEKWMKLESERFSQLVLRLFHTELEAVYEEFNRAYDRDSRRVYYKLFETLFPTHPYGTQTTIGKAEHLKNPSMVKIHEYFDKYYVPNNMAICLSGDLDPVLTMKWIEKYWGNKGRKEVPAWKAPKEKPLQSPKTVEIVGQDAESVTFAYRMPGAGTREALLLQLVDGILNNGTAGLLDLELNQKQRVLSAGCFSNLMEDYSAHIFSGRPKEGQNLEEVRDLMLEQIERVKEGDFEDWLVEAVVKDLRLAEMKAVENNNSSASAFVKAFTAGIPWEDYATRLDRMSKFTKKDVMDFAKSHYNDGMVTVFKRVGSFEDAVRLEKPPITPIPIRRGERSDFFRTLEEMDVPQINPVFLEFERDIASSKLNGNIPIYHVRNVANDLFELYYMFEMGSRNDKLMALAIDYLPYLGTDKYSAKELKQQFYKLGLSFSVSAGSERSFVRLSGLESSLNEGIALLEHILANVKADQEAYQELVSGILQERENSKRNKAIILRRGLVNLARYGMENPFNDILLESDLREQDPQGLVDRIQDLTTYQHEVFFYGTKSLDEITPVLNKHHKLKGPIQPVPPALRFEEIEHDRPIVYFAPYEMVQTEVVMLSKGPQYNPMFGAISNVFNTYYGRGLSSIFFQEIRESRALAYSSYAGFVSPRSPEDHYVLQAYIGTQADKLSEAIAAVHELFEEMPGSVEQFEASKVSVAKSIAADRITKSSIYFTWLNNRRMGIPTDIRQEYHATAQSIGLDQIEMFFDEHVKGKTFAYCIIGDPNQLDMEALNQIGEVRELPVEVLFGY